MFHDVNFWTDNNKVIKSRVWDGFGAWHVWERRQIRRGFLWEIRERQLWRSTCRWGNR